MIFFVVLQGVRCNDLGQYVYAWSLTIFHEIIKLSNHITPTVIDYTRVAFFPKYTHHEGG